MSVPVTKTALSEANCFYFVGDRVTANAHQIKVGFFHCLDGDFQVSNFCANELHKMVAEEWEKGTDGDGWCKRWEVALCKAYERADEAFKDMSLAPYSVGSTALVVILSPCQIIAANVGDSRVVLCRGKQAIPMTIDHKVSLLIFHLISSPFFFSTSV